LLAALLLASSPLWAESEAEPLLPLSRPASAPFSPASLPDALLVRVYANAARDDEFVEIGNPRPESVDISGWSLTDGEGTATFPLDSILPAGGRLLVTRNATSYEEDTLEAADFSFEAGGSRQMEGGVLRLADAGDEIALIDRSGTIVDVYAWGDSSYAGLGWIGRVAERMGRGEIATRVRDGVDGWVDRDIAEDWEGLRHHRFGQSAFDPGPIELRGATTAILSPDAGDIPLLRWLGSARATIEVGVYTFQSERIASVLAAAAGRGVHVRVLLDGSPVGGVEDDEHRVVGGLLAAGVEVRWLAGASDVVKRYRYLHAKYAIVDGRAAWIGSENFGKAGFPLDREGNRGWSAIVEDAELAAILRDVFETDFDPRRPDSIAARETVMEPLPSPPSTDLWSSGTVSGPRSARIVLAPDTTLDPEGILGLFASAKERLSIDAFYLDEMWRDTPSPFLEAAFAAARRGASVRILLDGSWASVEAESGTNDDVLERINARAKLESLPLEVRLLKPRGPIERLHNKGAVVDGRTVLVSSMNWALGSATENREVGLIVDDPALARTFETSFDADWEGRPTSGVDAGRLEDPLALVALYALVAVASALSLRKLRPRNKDIKPGARVRRRASLGAHLRGRYREVRLLPAELVAQSRPRARRRSGARRGRTEARGRVRGPEGD
jgi:phosphatidylserine/phosphatidylglycerophosphate/cardiolipin synthase-like enzyme